MLDLFFSKLTLQCLLGVLEYVDEILCVAKMLSNLSPLPLVDDAWSLALHVRPAILGNGVAVLVKDDECRDPPDGKVGFQGFCRVASVLNPPPVTMGLLHVGLHVLWRAV